LRFGSGTAGLAGCGGLALARRADRC
jgi:hypothetical protein